MAFRREEFGQDLRALLDRRRLSYRDVQSLTSISFSQVGDLCAGVVRTRSQIEKLIDGLDLDAHEWMLKAGFVPDGLAGDALLQTLMRLGNVAVIDPARFGTPRYDAVGIAPGRELGAPVGSTKDAIEPYDYTVRVRGDSMTGLLEEGDVAFVKAQDHALSGDVVVALVRDAVVVKRVRKANGTVTLVGANNRYEEIPGSEIRILGVLTGFYRRQ